jgi:CheY-like chemotaxis protein
MHGGTVHAESAGVGRGATFRVELPLARAADGRDAVQPLAGGGQDGIRGRRILVVDDDRDARLVIAAMLKRFGADVSPVSSVSEAMALLATNAFDAIVSDIAMPGEDGYSLVARARIPAVAVSAIATGPEDRRRALDAGFADFLRKPLEANELVEAVVRALR